MTVFDTLLARAPSAEAWSALCELFASNTLDGALVLVAEAKLATWPKALRSVELAANGTATPPAVSPWLRALFDDGALDPRLALIGWAALTHEREYALNEDPVRNPRSIVLAFARHLSPDFSPPDVVLYDEHEGAHASGVGGGWARAAWGDADRGVKYENTWVEHAADDETDDKWSAYGLSDGAVSIQTWDRGSGRNTLTLEGPTPAVFEIALAWRALLADPALSVEQALAGAVKDIATAKSASRDPPSAMIGALFVAENGKLACRIDRRADGDIQGAPFVATIWAGLGGALLLRRDFTGWRPATEPRSAVASERIGRLQVELGVVGMGETYDLYVTRPNPDLAIFGDKECVGALPDTPLAELRLFPEHGGSPYVADDWDWQDGWWYPYSTFRPATPEQQAAHEKR